LFSPQHFTIPRLCKVCVDEEVEKLKKVKRSRIKNKGAIIIIFCILKIRKENLKIFLVVIAKITFFEMFFVLE
jgi:hypothetical protein